MHSESYLLCSGYKIKPMENSKPERISGLGSSGFEFSARRRRSKDLCRAVLALDPAPDPNDGVRLRCVAGCREGAKTPRRADLQERATRSSGGAKTLAESAAPRIAQNDPFGTSCATVGGAVVGVVGFAGAVG